MEQNKQVSSLYLSYLLVSLDKRPHNFLPSLWSMVYNQVMGLWKRKTHSYSHISSVWLNNVNLSSYKDITLLKCQENNVGQVDI